MKTLFKILLVFFIILAAAIKMVNAEDSDSRPKVRAGTFAKVMVMEDFSTLTADIGDSVKFINTQDLYIYETNAVPENTIFYGEIEDIREPVGGKDASMKIFVYQMITPDKKVYNLNAHIYNENDNYIGGGNTHSMYYRKVPHYHSNMQPFLQATPVNVYEMGKHTDFKSGEQLFLIFEKDVFLK